MRPFNLKTLTPAYVIGLGKENKDMYACVPQSYYRQYNRLNPGFIKVRFKLTGETMEFPLDGHVKELTQENNFGEYQVRYYLWAKGVAPKEKHVIAIPRETKKEVLQKIGEILKSNPGKDEVSILVPTTDGVKPMVYPRMVNFTDELKKQIEELL